MTLPMFRVLWTLVAKDFRLESRNRDVILSVVFFAALVIALFAISIGTSRATAALVGPGVVWAAFAFSGVIGLARSAGHETDGGSTPLVMLAPVSRELIWLGKTIGNAIFLLMSLVAILVLYALFYDADVLRWELAVTGILLVIGFSGVGTLFSTMTLKVRARETLLPMMFLPLTSPLLFAAVEVTSEILSGGGWQDYGTWMMMALAYDVVFVTGSALLFPYALDE